MHVKCPLLLEHRVVPFSLMKVNAFFCFCICVCSPKILKLESRSQWSS